jgi:hypothetical protein
MVDVKTAVSSSLRYLGEVISPSQLRDVQLEEVMLSEDEKYWLVTFSYIRPEGVLNDKPSGELEASVKNAFPFNLVRDRRFFKTVKLRRDDGEFFGLTNLVA